MILDLDVGFRETPSDLVAFLNEHGLKVDSPEGAEFSIYGESDLPIVSFAPDIRKVSEPMNQWHPKHGIVSRVGIMYTDQDPEYEMFLTSLVTSLVSRYGAVVLDYNNKNLVRDYSEPDEEAMSG
jgi:hypothetical protein